MLIPNASPMMGSMSGATIIAPMTVATESPYSPKVAIADARVSRTQKRTSRSRSAGSSNITTSRTRAISTSSTGPPCSASPNLLIKPLS